MLSKIKSSFNPRVNDSTASQVTNSLQKSFKKLFKTNSFASNSTETKPDTSLSGSQDLPSKKLKTFHNLKKNIVLNS